MKAILIWLFGDLVAFFAKWLGKKAAIGAAAVGIGISLTLVMAATIKALLGGLYAGMPGWLGLGFEAVIPANFPYMLSAVLSAKTARFVYDWNMENLKIMSTIT